MINGLRIKVLARMIAIIAVASAFVLSNSVVHAATTPVTGYAWSSNIGWISFSSSNAGPGATPAYGVNVDTTTGVMSGYAWSSNIGWISFNAADVSTCGTTFCTPKINMTTGAVTGWIRVVSGIGRTDGWDGWIELSGTGHTSPDITGAKGVTLATSTGAIKGYAWGGNVIGWVLFNPSITPATCSGCVVVPSSLPSVTISANPTAVNSGASSLLTWNAKNSTSCTATGSWSGTKAATPGDHTEMMTNIISNRTYTITCTNGTVGAWASVDVTVNPSAPTVTLTATPSSVSSGGSTSLSWTSANATACTASGDWSGSKALASNSSPEVKTNLTSNKTYTLTCTNAFGSASDTENVTVGGGGGTDPTCPSGNCGEIPNGDSEIQLYLGSTSVLSKTFDSVNPPERDPSKVAPYLIKKGGTFNMKWVTTLASDYECTTYTRKIDNKSAYGLWPRWDEAVSVSGSLSDLQTSSSNINIGTYVFYLTCSDNNPANGLGEEKRSNPSKLQIRQSDIQEI